MTRFVLSVLIALTCVAANAQSWQWGRRGGSTNNNSGGYDQENVVDMATDKNGNVYVASHIISSSPNPVTLGSTPIVTWEDSFRYHTPTTLIASYDCNGAVRWAKAIGGSTSSIPVALRVDTLGHVYLLGKVGFVQSGIYGQVPVHFGMDTVLPFDLRKSVFLAQYDTSGNFKWLRMPQADTIADFGRAYQAGAYDMEVDNSGNLNTMLVLPPGAIGGSNMAISSYGTYILKYSPQGTLLSVAPTPLHIQGYATQTANSLTYFPSARMTCTKSGKWIFAGTQLIAPPDYVPMAIGADTVRSAGFLFCFDSQWNLLWRRINDSMGVAGILSNGISGRVVADDAEHLYIGGYTRNGNTLYGDTTRAPLEVGGVPCIAKLDISGARIWVNYATDNRSTTQPITYAGASVVGLALRPDGSLLTTGSCGGLKWGAFQIAGLANTGLNIFLSRHDGQTGAILQLDTLKHLPGYTSTPSCMVGDRKGDAFIGGLLDGYLVIGPDTVHNSGGLSDFFVGKYGFGCCAQAPSALFAATHTSAGTVQFTYSGTTAGIDSLVWDFGDGQRQKVTAGYTTPLMHTYAGGGLYRACVTVYSACGQSRYCKDNALSTGSVSTFGSVKVYPNPVTDRLMIEGAKGGSAVLCNALGQQVQRIAISQARQEADLSAVTPGVYMLLLQDQQGQRAAVRVVKQ